MDEKRVQGAGTSADAGAGAPGEPPAPPRRRIGRSLVVPFLIFVFIAVLVSLVVEIEEPSRDGVVVTLLSAAGIVALAGLVILLDWRGREASTLRALMTAERERRSAEVRHAALMREASEIVLLLDTDNIIVEANDFALRTYGYSRDEFVGRPVESYRVPQEDVSIEDRRRQLEDARGHITFDSLHRRRDGVEFPVEVSLSSVGIEGEKYYLEIVRDVAERRAAEAALRVSEARYRTLFESALSGFALHEIVLGDDGEPIDYVFLAANPAFEQQSGLAVADVIGRRASEIVPGLHETGLVERYGRVALTGETERFETYVPELGRHFDIQVVSPQPGQFATIFLDISQRRKAEDIVSGFFGSSPVGLFILDRDLRYVRVNETLAAMDRITPEDHEGRAVQEVQPGLADLVERSLTHVLDTAESLHEIPLESPPGSAEDERRHALVSLFPIADPDGLVQFIGGVVVDVTPARQAERELRDSRAFLEHVLEVTPEVIYIFDIAEQRNVFSNRQMLELLGYSPKEILAMGEEVLPQILHPDDRAVMARHHAGVRSLADGEVLQAEYRMRHADGEWRILHGRDTVFLRDEAGAVTQLIGTAQDVTGQRQAEARMAQLSQRLEATVLASPLAIVALDAERRVQLWNPAAAATLGWTADETIGRPVPFIPPEAAGQVEALQERLAAGEQFAGLDLPCVRKDGRRIHTSTSLALMHGEAGLPDSVLIIIEDVTERLANVVRLARMSRLYQVLSAVTEAIPEEREPQRLYEEVCRIIVEEGGFGAAWVGATRRDGSVKVVAVAGAASADDAARIGTRLPADRLSTIGVALAEGRSDMCPDMAADPRMAPLAGMAGELGLRSAAAVPIVVDGRHDTALAIFSQEIGGFDSEEIGLLERLAADVGFAIEAAARQRARRKAERELARLNRDLERRVLERTAELEAANEELEAFSYSVSHDLRAPLRALDGFSLALLEDYADRLDGDASDYLARIRAASQRMAGLIDDLLMLSRVTRREMTWEPVDLSALAAAIGAELADEHAGRQVELLVAQNMTVDGDAHLIEVALRNLLDNAWKFTGRTAAARVEVGVEDGADERVFFVRDNGAGFDTQYADTLFGPFQRLHGDDEFPGTGIGLATVHRIVRRHGGRVWADGVTGGGATLRFTFGLQEEGQ